MLEVTEGNQVSSLSYVALPEVINEDSLHSIIVVKD